MTMKWCGRLAQLVERVVDIDEVAGSSPVPTTIHIGHRLFVSFKDGRLASRRYVERAMPPSSVGLELLPRLLSGGPCLSVRSNWRNLNSSKIIS